MRFISASVLLGCVLAGSLAAADHPARVEQLRCPTHVLETKTTMVDTTSGVDLTITTTEAKRVPEIRRRADRVVEAARTGTPAIAHLDLCEVVVQKGTITTGDIDGGVKISIRAQTPVAVEALQSEAHQRHQRRLDTLAKPHSMLLVDARSSSEVWVDGVDSGYQTPTDGIILGPGLHQVSLDGPGQPSSSMSVLLRRDETRRLYIAPAK